MEREALLLLKEHLGLRRGSHAVMLTGGRTPLGLYKALEADPGPAAEGLSLLISDERHVPIDAAESNYGPIRRVATALQLDDSHVMRVRTEYDLEQAAADYDNQLSAYVDVGVITLGLLGLGTDGHVASLFSADDLATGRGRYAIPVPRENGPDRISVTCDLLAKVERLVFLVAGPEKAEIVSRAETSPDTVIALQAVKGTSAELWYSP